MKKRKIAYVGWLGRDNLGDEALFDMAKECFSDFDLENVVLKRKAAIQKFFLKRKGYAGCLLGGGTLLYSGYQNLRTVEFFQSIGVPLFAYGSGVSCGVVMGDDSDQDRIERWDKVIAGMSRVGVRGPISAKCLKERGFDNVDIVGDPGVLTGSNSVAVGEDKVIGVNIGTARNDVWGGDESNIVPETVGAVKLFRENGWTVKLFTIWPKDDQMVMELAEKAGVDRSDIVRSYVDCRDYQSKAAQCTVFMGLKLHATILACAEGVPSIMLSYRVKCDDFMESIDADDRVVRVDEMNSQNMYDMAEAVYAKRSEVAASQSKAVSEYREKLSEYVEYISQNLL